MAPALAPSRRRGLDVGELDAGDVLVDGAVVGGHEERDELLRRQAWESFAHDFRESVGLILEQPAQGLTTDADDADRAADLGGLLALLQALPFAYRLSNVPGWSFSQPIRLVTSFSRRRT